MFWTQIMTDNELYNYEYLSREDVCRLCWSENAVKDIAGTGNDENQTENFLSQIIKDCLQIDVNDKPNNKVCDNCYNEINRFYSFKHFCQETDTKLKSILENGFTELKFKDFTSDIVKTENVDDEIEKIDNIDSYFDEPIDYDELNTKKALKTNPKARKKYVIKRPPTHCNICCFDLETMEKLSDHNAELHGIENNGTAFKCFGCEKRFKSRRTRISHESNFCKGLTDGYKCSLCHRYLPKRCMYEFHLRDHRHNITEELPEDIFKCKQCLQAFRNKELLKNHIMDEHGPGKNFVCDICGRVFTRQDYLYKHKFTHTGVRSHQCPHCEFRTAQRSSLTVHIRKHTGERPYSCDLCPQKCISSSNLRAHRRRHLGVKKYECTICNKKFGYKISLEEHITSAHVRSESHPCEHCGATYTRVRGLRRHLAAKHGKQAKKNEEQDVLVQITNTDGGKIDILKEVDYEVQLKDGNNVLLLKHQDGDVYMV